MESIQEKIRQQWEQLKKEGLEAYVKRKTGKSLKEYPWICNLYNDELATIKIVHEEYFTKKGLTQEESITPEKEAEYLTLRNLFIIELKGEERQAAFKYFSEHPY